MVRRGAGSIQRDDGGEDVGVLADVLVEPQQAVAVGVHPLLAVEPFLDVGIERGGEADLARGDDGVALDVELPPDEQAGGGGGRQNEGRIAAIQRQWRRRKSRSDCGGMV